MAPTRAVAPYLPGSRIATAPDAPYPARFVYGYRLIRSTVRWIAFDALDKLEGELEKLKP